MHGEWLRLPCHVGGGRLRSRRGATSSLGRWMGQGSGRAAARGIVLAVSSEGLKVRVRVKMHHSLHRGGGVTRVYEGVSLQLHVPIRVKASQGGVSASTSMSHAEASRRDSRPGPSI